MGYLHFFENASFVSADGLDADGQRLSNFRQRLACRYSLKHVELALRKAPVRQVAGRFVQGLCQALGHGQADVHTSLPRP